ncbi:MAG: YifB family Mg chelatase-like AAA ATPase [Patescibacteria group bacterium]
MQLQNITSSTLFGINAQPVIVETDISPGLPAFNIVGLPDASVKESKERIRAAIKNSGFAFPRTRVTVNLAPADVKKQGPIFDLPIALSILLAQGEFDRLSIENTIIIGELSLNGSVRPIVGTLATAIMAKSKNFGKIIVPQENTQEAGCIKSLKVFGAKSIISIVNHLQNKETITPHKYIQPIKNNNDYLVDMEDIKGQETAKRGIEIAASGSHNILMYGPPGTGKTMLAKSLPSILPQLDLRESLETTSIASVAGELGKQSGLMQTRPFRNPHHSCSAVSLVGGGTWPKPGEVSLAHRGVLFLDELPEFSRHVLENLRQPLEDGEVTVARAAASLKFPAKFMLVATMNPCPCGNKNNENKICTCSFNAISNYHKRISSPLLDRFDIFIEVPNLNAEKLLGSGLQENSMCVRQRVQNAREKQKIRFKKTNLITNSEIPNSKIKNWCAPDIGGIDLLKKALDSKLISARGFVKIQKVARTIADLDNSELVTVDHVSEALQYRHRQNTIF